MGSIGLGYLGKEILLSSTMGPVVSGSVKVMPLVLSLLGAIVAYGMYDLVRIS